MQFFVSLSTPSPAANRESYLHFHQLLSIAIRGKYIAMNINM
jgi:hypothetical protein